MRAEEMGNQRHTRGHDANPLISLETLANVTVRALEESRGLLWRLQRNHNEEYVGAEELNIHKKRLWLKMTKLCGIRALRGSLFL